MLDPFVILAPILLLPVVALLGFVGCAAIIGLNQGILYTPVLKFLGSAMAVSTGKAAPALALSLNTTNCNLIVLVAADFELSTNQSNQDTITDDQGNTYKVVNTATTAPNSIAIWCCTNAKGASLHTISVAGSFTALAVLWAQYANTTDATDQSNIQSASHASRVTLPTIVPSQNGALIVTGVSADASSFAVDSGFTLIGQEPFTSGVNAGLAVAYQVQATAGAVSPTWTAQSPGTSPIIACIASFK
jgi:hypothetical protein